MRRDQLEHAIRTACQIIQHREVIVVGSQAILGTYDESQLPAAATMSIEVDLETTVLPEGWRERRPDRIASINGLRGAPRSSRAGARLAQLGALTMSRGSCGRITAHGPLARPAPDSGDSGGPRPARIVS